MLSALGLSGHRFGQAILSGACPLMALSGLLEGASRTSDIEGKADIPPQRTECVSPKLTGVASRSAPTNGPTFRGEGWASFAC